MGQKKITQRLAYITAQELLGHIQLTVSEVLPRRVKKEVVKRRKCDNFTSTFNISVYEGIPCNIT